MILIMKRFRFLFFCALTALLASCSQSPKDYELHVVTTGDVHGAWFDRPYVDGQENKTSLMAVKAYVDSLRTAVGADNVLLLDAGDILQGDNAPYYFNYVDTLSAHLYPRIAKYMGYDALVVGNHDIETGHPIYDRLNSELKAAGISWLGGNAIDTATGKTYFPVYRIFKRAGLRVAVLGFTNPNMSAWLDESLWKGIEFRNLLPLVQEDVDAVISKEHPDAVIVVVHSGTGDGSGTVLESQGLDLLNSLKGVDLIVTSHDHRPLEMSNGTAVLINGGARAANVGRAVIKLSKQGRKLLSKNTEGWPQKIDRNKVDEAMEEAFAPEFEEVKAFTLRHVGELAMDLKSIDAYQGMSDYINLIHTVQLETPDVQISFAAPLSFNGLVKAGQVIYNDMFTIYPYENQMYVMKLNGSEIKSYLELSYENWIQTSDEHVLRIANNPDPRTGAQKWSFVKRSYNFDSAAGIVYTVDVTKPYGSRISISSMADGSEFKLDAWYNVAMTSYRANGGGDLVINGANVPKSDIDSRIVARYPEIREMVYQYISKSPLVTPSMVGDTKVIGSWRFVPEAHVAPLMKKDIDLVF